MRARKKKQNRFKDMLPSQRVQFPRRQSFEGMLEGDSAIADELAAHENAIEARVRARKQYASREFGDEPNIPRIAGYTDMANASPEMKMAGYLEYIGKTPQERYADSELGRQVSMSMSSRHPGDAQLSDMAQGNSYWAGLARNIAYGDDLPEAHLPRMDAEEGQKWSDPGRTSPMGESAERPYSEESRPQSRQNTYTGFANQTQGRQQTQSLEGITRSAFQDATLRDAARGIEDLRKTDPEAAAAAEEDFFRYMGDKYGVSDQKSVSKVFNALRGRP